MPPNPARRHFLKLSLHLPAIAALTSCGSASDLDSSLTTPHPTLANSNSGEAGVIIVIGAGMAGLGAARALTDAGYRVLVLEARNRLGGRVWTSRAWPEIPLDMGASWIHGVEGNPITALAKKINAKTLVTDYDDGWVYDVDGRRLGDEETDAVYEMGEEILEEVNEMVDPEEEDYSLAEAIEEVIEGEALSKAERQRLNFYLNTIIEQEFAADTSELSASHTDDSEEFEGDDVIFPEGYDRIVHYLAPGLAIQLEQIVTEISYDRQGVTVVTNRGKFQAERVIVTLPLGVLQQGQITFSPALPEEKRAAIRTLGSGVLNKLYLRFPQVFWPKELEIINYISAEKGVWSEWYNFYYYLDQPVLLGFNAGQYGRKIEALSDEEIVAGAMAVLRRLYGDDIPEPEAWQLTRWASDPFALGSYSYNAVGASVENRAALAEPVENRLFFAGEATSLEYPATVHGAYLSGLREAKRIMKLS